MKRTLPILAAALLCLLLAGCRVRLVGDPALAKELWRAPDTTEATQPPETTEPTQPTEATEASEPTEPETEAPTEPEPTQARPQAPAQPAAPQPGGGQSTPDPAAPGPGEGGPAPAVTEPEPTEPTEPQAQTVTVTYEPNGGEGDALSVALVPGGIYGTQPQPARLGYNFDGWWTEPEGGALILPESVITLPVDHSLYAHWREAAGFTLTLDGNGGRVKAKDSTQTIRPGEAFGTLPTPLREGYDFTGWYTAPEGGEAVGAEDVFDGSGNLTLYAHWDYDAYAFWSFTLENKTQQIYLCQQTPIYVETQDHVTMSWCGLVSDTGSTNVAAGREDPNVDDDWVLAKNPSVILKVVDSMSQAGAAREALSARFGGRRVIVATYDALGGGAYGLYARLALGKALYGDWYTDVDLGRVYDELGLGYSPISTG